MPGAEENVASRGIKIPSVVPPPPGANLRPTNYSMGVLHVSGQFPNRDDGSLVIGQCGKDVTVEEGTAAARLCGLSILGLVRAALGSLDRVKKVIKITCFVNSTPDFTQQPAVANGCSDLMVEVFGREVGLHARCAIGMGQLPHGVAVEIDAQMEIEGHPESL